MIYRSAAVVTMDGPPIRDGGVVVHGERIAAAGSFREVRAQFGGEEVTDLGLCALLPGLINAHCHLDYSGLRHAILPQATFTAWIGRINAIKRSLDLGDYLAAIRLGFSELRRWGTTSVLNIESFPELMWQIPRPPLRTWWFYELIDVRSAIATEDLVAGALLFFQDRPGWLGGCGLSPHAPYTASPELYQLTRNCSRRTAMPWTTHLGESRDEREMFALAQGPLYRFLSGLGRPMGDCGRGRSALAQLAEAGALGPECIVVHLNEVEEEDYRLLASGGPLAGLHVVHCPGSHHYFRHTPFPCQRLRAVGVNLCIGTDSPASDGSFSLLEELRGAARDTAPDLAPEELLAMVTLNPARALGLAGELGCIRPGAFADLAAFPIDQPSADPRNIYAQVLACRAPAQWMLIHGRDT